MRVENVEEKKKSRWLLTLMKTRNKTDDVSSNREKSIIFLRKIFIKWEDSLS